MPLNRQALHRLAEQCEQRARACDGDEARGRFNRAAADARRDATARYISPDGLRLAYDAADAQARFAAWCDGDRPAPDVAPSIAPAPPPAIQVPARSPDARRPRQLGALFGMSERGALKRITHAFHRGVPGFYRDGRRWFAEPAAFEQFRMSSD